MGPALMAGFQVITNGRFWVITEVTLKPFVGLGAQLCPCGLATTTQQTFELAPFS